MRKIPILFVVLLLALTGPVFAQEAASPAEPPAVPDTPEVTFTVRSRIDVGDAAVPQLPVALIRRLHDEATLVSMDLTTEGGHGRLILRFTFTDTPAFEAWYERAATQSLFEELGSQGADDLQVALFVKRL